ncbi:MAG: hypothetical protein AB2A00_40340 [Myxococcota bacterium]
MTGLSQERRVRVRAVFFVVLLLGWHALLVQRAHHHSSVGALVGLGAYAGLLGALATFLGVASGWHQSALRPGARVSHVMLGAWLVGGMGALVGAALAGLSHVTSQGTERAVGAAFIGPGLAAVLAARPAQLLLERLATRPPATPLRPRPLQARLMLFAAFTSGAFGVLHPPVRFPLDLPASTTAMTYALAGVMATGLLVPLAAFRLTAGLVHSGVVLHAQGQPRWEGLWLVAVLGALLVAPTTWWAPETLTGWCVYRGLAGAVLGMLSAGVGSGLGARVAIRR